MRRTARRRRLQPVDASVLRHRSIAILAALVAHAPSRLQVTTNVRFTEDTHVLALGEGFWKTVSGQGTYRQDFLDVRAQTAGALVVMKEGDHPVLFVLRLKVADRRISEVETMVVHTAKEGAFMDIAALKTASVPMNLPVPAGQRETRDNAIAHRGPLSGRPEDRQLR